jgi:photosystem II stability/assembly factor-like uncharacterized protein
MSTGSSSCLAAIATATALLSASAARSTELAVGPGVPEGSLVAFPTPNLGYFVTPAGAVRRSQDGGQTWRRVGRVAPLVAVDFVSATHGFGLSTRGVLWTTGDAGRTWQTTRRFTQRSGEYRGPAPPMVVDFVDEEFGFVAAGPRRLFRTRNGGRSWQRLRFGCQRYDYLGGLAFANRRVGFAACGGQPATAMQRRSYAFTADGGTTWRHSRNRIESGHVAFVASPLPRVRYLYASRLGIFRLKGPVLLFTNDRDSVLAMSWPSPRVGYALLLHGGLKRTSDGGRHWRRL